MEQYLRLIEAISTSSQRFEGDIHSISYDIEQFLIHSCHFLPYDDVMREETQRSLASDDPNHPVLTQDTPFLFETTAIQRGGEWCLAIAVSLGPLSAIASFPPHGKKTYQGRIQEWYQVSTSELLQQIVPILKYLISSWKFVHMTPGTEYVGSEVLDVEDSQRLQVLLKSEEARKSLVATAEPNGIFRGLVTDVSEIEPGVYAVQYRDQALALLIGFQIHRSYGVLQNAPLPQIGDGIEVRLDVQGNIATMTITHRSHPTNVH